MWLHCFTYIVVILQFMELYWVVFWINIFQSASEKESKVILTLMLNIICSLLVYKKQVSSANKV